LDHKLQTEWILV